MIKETTLTRFIKDECSYYDRHYQQCTNIPKEFVNDPLYIEHPCKALSGEQCGYFEKAVLGPSDYLYRLPGYDYSKLFAQYAAQTGTKKCKVKVRRCECGTPLRNRQRYCGKCVKKRRRETKRNAMRKYRHN